MRNYQLYVVDVANDEIEDVTVVIRCKDDSEVIQKVERLTDRYDVEIWSGSTFIHLCSPSRGAGLPTICSAPRIQNDDALVTIES